MRRGGDRSRDRCATPPSPRPPRLPAGSAARLAPAPESPPPRGPARRPLRPGRRAGRARAPVRTGFRETSQKLPYPTFARTRRSRGDSAATGHPMILQTTQAPAAPPHRWHWARAPAGGGPVGGNEALREGIPRAEAARAAHLRNSSWETSRGVGVGSVSIRCVCGSPRIRGGGGAAARSPRNRNPAIALLGDPPGGSSPM